VFTRIGLKLGAGFTVSVPFAEPFSVAVMATGVTPATDCVSAVNVAVLELAATVTVAGTVAADVLPLSNWTIAPPAGAAAFNVTVPVELVPPVTELGLSVTNTTLGIGFTVSVVLFVP
jgi:hypothetical protein